MAQSFLWFKFDFHLFWCLIMNVNEFETKENYICVEGKIELQYLHQVVMKVNGSWKVLWQSQHFFERVLRLILLSSIFFVVSEEKKPFQMLETENWPWGDINFWPLVPKARKAIWKMVKTIQIWQGFLSSDNVYIPFSTMQSLYFSKGYIIQGIRTERLA